MNQNTVQDVLHAATKLFQPGDVVEVRVPKAGKLRTISGYFDNFEKLAEEVSRLETAGHPGIYWTLNPVNRSLLARAENKTKAYAADTTSKPDIMLRRWLLADFDPIRPTGISATDEEHGLALKLAEEASVALSVDGWPEPIYSDSGNGGHLLYAVDLPNDDDSEALVRGVLQGLIARFSTDRVEVDRAVFDANRICKIYGTTARKGDNTETRPHRLSHILQIPGLITPVPIELLCALAATAPAKDTKPAPRLWQPRGNLPAFDLQAFLNKHGVRYRPPAAFEGSGLKYTLECCPFDPSHKDKDAAVFIGRAGALGFKCFHNSCSDRNWHSFREFFEPRRERPMRPVLVQAPTEEPPNDVLCGDGDAGPISSADVEAAVDLAIANRQIDAAIRLAPDIARQPGHIQVLIQAKLRQAFKRDFPAQAFARALKEARKQNDAAPPDHGAPQEPADEGPDLLGYPLTDSGNKDRIVALYAADIRYCAEFKSWLLWDGQRWRRDEVADVTQYAERMARMMYAQAKTRPGLDSSLRAALMDHARHSESHSAITAALNRTLSHPGIVISQEDLDCHKFLLNFRNGVLDLRTGQLLPHDRSYLITKLVEYDYKPDALAPRFLKFINRIMGETPDDAEPRESVTRLVGFLQKAFGYSLTGDISEKATFILYGPKGNNGKTTLVTLIATIFEDYSTLLDITTLMESRASDSSVREDMARLRGARFVVASEVDEQQPISVRLLKKLTPGTGKITARRLYEHAIEFFAEHKLFIDTNNLPDVRGGGDAATWDRLLTIPFLVHIPKEIDGEPNPEMDKKLDRKLLAEAEGVIAWLVRGAMQWAKDGSLGNPPEVKAAGVEWQETADPLKQFLEDCCEIGEPVAKDVLTRTDGYWVQCRHLSAAYVHWCKENEEKRVLGRGKFNDRLMRKGFRENRSRRNDANKQMRTWEGVRLREDVTLPLDNGSGRSGDYREF